MTENARKYRAFISYSHADEQWANRLQRKLESFKLPRHLREPGADDYPLRPVFRDRNELSSASRLSDVIEQALDRSAALIVICSPSAAASKWVNEEVRYFRQHYPERPVLALLVAGRPEDDPRESSEAAFPLSVMAENVASPEQGLMDPLAADARRQGDGFQMALLKLAAGLLGVGFDELWRRQQKATQRRWALLSTTLFALLLVFGVLTWQALQARDEARLAQARAQLELTAEQQTRRFLLSIFSLSGAEQARGSEVTVRSVLDRAVATIDATDFDKPVVRARMLTTMGQAYSSLGQNQTSVDLLQKAIEIIEIRSSLDAEQRIRSRIELADVWFNMGDADSAREALRLAEDDIHAFAENDPVILARWQNVFGDVEVYYGDLGLARQAYQTALMLGEDAQANMEAHAEIVGHALGGMGRAAFFEGDVDGAVAFFQRAHEMLQNTFGDLHPATNWALGSLGSAAKMNGESELAETSWKAALANAEQLFDPLSPEIATLQNNLAWVSLEQGKVAEAQRLLEDVLASDRAHRSANFDGLVYTLNNLAVVRIDAGEFEQAKALLEEALPIAEEHGHEMTGSILTQLADMQCELGATDEGVKLIERALGMLFEQYGEENWRYARAIVTKSFCQGSDDYTGYLSVLEGAWSTETPYLKRVRQQIEAINGPA